MKKAIKRAFTGHGESDKVREERSEFGVDEHGDFFKKNWEEEKKSQETVRNKEDV